MLAKKLNLCWENTVPSKHFKWDRLKEALGMHALHKTNNQIGTYNLALKSGICLYT